jgi:spore germination protein GerM
MSKIRIVFVALTLVLAVASLSACGVGQARDGAEAAGSKDHIKLVLYFGNEDASELVAEERYVPRSDVSPEMVALQELISGPKSSAGRRTLPEETVVLMVEVRDKVAFVDLSQSTVDNHSGGSAGDQMSVMSLVYTLTELPGIEEVQLLLEGEVVDAIFGHVATNQPISR